jgi:hypothetical protein
VTDPDGLETLHIAAGTDGRCTASWRRRVALEPGKYVFEGRARTVGVVPLEQDSASKGVGAGLRRGRAATARANSIVGDSPWQTLAYEFALEDEEEVDLLCELRPKKARSGLMSAPEAAPTLAVLAR